MIMKELTVKDRPFRFCSEPLPDTKGEMKYSIGHLIEYDAL